MNKNLDYRVYLNEASDLPQGGEPSPDPKTQEADGKGTNIDQIPQGSLAGKPTGDVGDLGDWRDRLDLPDDIKSSKVLNNIKNPYEDPSDVISQLVNANKLIGEDRIQAPKEDWNEEQKGEFYNKIGRPPESEGYKFDEIAEEHKGMFDEQATDAFKEKFHKRGLTQDQANGIMNDYREYHISAMQTFNEQLETQIQKNVEDFRVSEGDNYDMTMHLAHSSVLKHGGQELLDHLVSLNIDRDPKIIKAFANIGKSTLESQADGKGGGDFLTGKAAAMQEKQKLMGDTEFLRVLNSSSRDDKIAHDAAVDRLASLNEKIFSD